MQKLFLMSFILSSMGVAQAGICLNKDNKKNAEAACALATKMNPGKYSETKVSMFCGDIGVKWAKLVEFGSCSCCVLAKQAGSNTGLFGKTCVGQNQPAAERLVLSQKNYWDKFGHCAVSCILTNKCGMDGGRFAAHGKEIKDLFDSTRGNSYGSGDLDADRKGFEIYRAGARTDQACMAGCSAAYPKK